MIEINLLPPQNVLSQKEKVFRQYLLVGVVGASALSILALFIIFVGREYYGLRAASLARQRSVLTQRLQSEQETAVTLERVNDKVLGIKFLTKNRADFAKVLTRLAAILPLGAKLGTVSLETGGVVNFTATVPDAGSLKLVLQNLSGSSEIGKFSSVVVSGLREDEKGILAFSVEAKYE